MADVGCCLSIEVNVEIETKVTPLNTSKNSTEISFHVVIFVVCLSLTFDHNLASFYLLHHPGI